MAGISAEKILVTDGNNSSEIIILGTRPDQGAGYVAPKGSIGILTSATPATIWKKYGDNDTDWQVIADTSASPATFTIGHIGYGATADDADVLYDPSDPNRFDLLNDTIQDSITNYGFAVIHILRGEYEFDRTYSFTGPVYLIGESRDNVIFLNGQSLPYNFSGQFAIRNIQFGKTTSRVLLDGFTLSGGDCILENCAIYKTTNQTVFINNDSGRIFSIRDCYIESDLTVRALEIQGQSGTKFSFENTVVIFGTEGIYLNTSSQVFFDNSKVLSNSNVATNAVVLTVNELDSIIKFSRTEIGVLDSTNDTLQTCFRGYNHYGAGSAEKHYNIYIENCRLSANYVFVTIGSYNNVVFTNNIVEASYTFVLPNGDPDDVNSNGIEVLFANNNKLSGGFAYIDGTNVSILKHWEVSGNHFSSTANVVVVRNTTGFTDMLFSSNADLDFDVEATTITDITIVGNKINGTIKLHANQGSERIIISGNNCVSSSVAALNIDKLSSGTDYVHHVNVAGNIFYTSGNTSSRFVLKAKNVNFHNNTIYRNPTSDGTSDFNFGSVANNINISHNTLMRGQVLAGVNLYLFSLVPSGNQIRFVYNDVGGALEAVPPTTFNSQIVYGETTPNAITNTNWNLGTYDAGGGGA